MKDPAYVLLAKACEDAGISIDTGRRKIKSQEWTAKRKDGRLWVKVGNAKALEPEAKPQKQEDTLESLRKRKLKAEAEYKELQNENLWQSHYLAWESEYMGAFAKSFAPLKEVVRQIGLTPDQVEKYNKALDECIEDLKSKAGSIFENPH